MTNHHDVTLTWLQSDQLEQYQPYRQVYGVVFNATGEILLIQENGKWKIPGGTPEANETAEETLRRELTEEADVTISKLAPIGVQRVEHPNNPNTGEGDVFYQYRYACLLDELQPSSPDPATGMTHPRKFVPAAQVTDHVKWGPSGDAMFKAAIKVYEEKLA
jgi:ADP-ribose pyrophosphatase YjhB (NUDIX family)